MACPNKNRNRPRTVAFRLTDEEFMRLEQKVKITGEVKGDYLREMALTGEININVGKYKSDKLALVLKCMLRELHEIAEKGGKSELYNKISICQILLEEMHELISVETSEFLSTG